jgi:thioesterase domain-containing protein
VVAFEMARRLEAAGEPVGAVFLLDTPPPGDGEGVEEPSLSRVLAFFAGEAGLAVDRDQLEEADPEVAVRRVAEVAVAAGLLPASGAEEYLRHRLDLLGRNLSASARYRVDAPIDAPVVYLRTTAEDPRETAGGGDPTRGWSRRSRRPVRLHLLPGDHWSFLSEPEVAEVARLLEEAVVESATSNPSTSTEPVLQKS